MGSFFKSADYAYKLTAFVREDEARKQVINLIERHLPMMEPGTEMTIRRPEPGEYTIPRSFVVTFKTDVPVESAKYEGSE